MGTELFTLTPDTAVGSALRLATSKQIHHFLVIDDGSLAGIVCESDLLQARAGSLVESCMRSPVLCIGPETTVREAADIMAENAVGCLPVVTGAFLVGMVTRDRLEQLAGKDATRARSDAVDAVEEVGPIESPICAACGGTEGVTPNVRAGLLELCTDCSAIVPALDPPRGN
jgi:CBS domain-containing protein